MSKIKDVWQSFTHKFLGSGKPGEIVEVGAEISKAALEFAMAIGLGFIAPNAPVVAATLSLVGITRKILTLLNDDTKEKSELEKWVAIAFPLAYINSFNELIQKNIWLKEKIGAGISEQEVQLNLNEVGELQLDKNLAEEALKNFPESTLGKALNHQLSTYLTQAGINKCIAPIITGWVAWGTYKHIESLLTESPLLDNIRLLTLAAQEITANNKYASIELYLQEQISPNPSDPQLLERWKVIDEEFKFPAIYVPLKAHLLDSNGKYQKDVDLVDLETWAKDHLKNPDKSHQVMFIQAGPGRGKSVLCRMFADWVRENLHPIWTPILIRLRDVDAFEANIENTLKAAVRQNFTNSNNWLDDRNTRFLFILDGFDELRFVGRTVKGVKDFLQQVGNYQKRSDRHLFLVTGRESALHGLENQVPTNLERVEIALMDSELQKQWLTNWGKLVGQNKAETFQKFLEPNNCPKRVQELAQEPLLLYLLAAMHRDDKLNTEMFAGSSSANAKILVYQTTMNWVLTKQRPIEITRDITELDTEDLRTILIEAGLCVTQSGREWTSIKIIEERLKGDKAVKQMLEEAQQHLGENPLRNALAAFYLRPAKASETSEGAVEFIHKSFGEFLCAQKLIITFKKWVKVDSESRRKTFITSDERLAEEIYDLLSYGGLTSEIVGYLIALLDANNQFEYLDLFERLNDFYLDWCQGKFINEYPRNLPLNQMQKLRDQEMSIGLREVDIYAGLNIMVLLLEIHRYAQNKDELKDKIAFFPCSQEKKFDSERLHRIIGYSNSVISNTFSKTIGFFLSGANLSGANLEGADLSGANLEGADLSGTHLSGAYLEGAELDGANLLRANLLRANLSRADLSRANLSGANLSGANLSRAHLSGANLSRAYLSRANLSRAYLGGANLEGAELEGAELEGANLLRADLLRADLLRANLEGADLSGANLSRANLEGANLEGADLSGANLEGAKGFSLVFDK